MTPHEALVKNRQTLFGQARFFLGVIGVQTHPFLLLAKNFRSGGV